jgi:hypothetical protein
VQTVPVLDPSLNYLANALFGLLLSGFAWWLKSISSRVDNAMQQLADLKLKVAEEYATKELVDKMEIRIIAALTEFKMDIKTELQRLFNTMENHHNP